MKLQPMSQAPRDGSWFVATKPLQDPPYLDAFVLRFVKESEVWEDSLFRKWTESYFSNGQWFQFPASEFKPSFPTLSEHNTREAKKYAALVGHIPLGVCCNQCGTELIRTYQVQKTKSRISGHTYPAICTTCCCEYIIHESH